MTADTFLDLTLLDNFGMKSRKKCHPRSNFKMILEWMNCDGQRLNTLTVKVSFGGQELKVLLQGGVNSVESVRKR